LLDNIYQRDPIRLYVSIVLMGAKAWGKGCDCSRLDYRSFISYVVFLCDMKRENVVLSSSELISLRVSAVHI
jgi:hypothetical protein